jgi:hypothetical protein
MTLSLKTNSAKNVHQIWKMKVPSLLKLASLVLSNNLYSRADSEEYLHAQNVPASALIFFKRVFKPSINVRRLIFWTSIEKIRRAHEGRRVTRRFLTVIDYDVKAGNSTYGVEITVRNPNVYCVYINRKSSNWGEMRWNLFSYP